MAGMKFLFYHKDIERYSKQEKMLQACVSGAAVHGDEVIPVDHWDRIPMHVTGCVLLGFGKVNKWIFDAYINAHDVVYWDTGYIGCNHWRVSVNSHQPIAYFMNKDQKPDRWKRLGVEVKPYNRPGRIEYQRKGTHILFDGASNKFIRWHELGGNDFRMAWHNWGLEIAKKIQESTKKPIIYRPRPSTRAKFQPALPIPGTEFSDGPLHEDFDRAAVVVSYGGTIGVDSVVYGVPHFAIGNSPARPVSETAWARLDHPFIPSDKQRLQYLHNLAYCQWTLEEIASGEAWGHIKQYFRSPMSF